MKRLAMTVAVAAIVSSGLAQAATDGTRGPSSTGDIGVTLEIGNNVIVTNLDDMALGTWDQVNDVTASEDFCIGQNYSGNVDVTLSSANPGGASGWQLLGSNGGLLSYDLSWDNGGAAQPFSEGSVTDATMVSPQDLNCVADNNRLNLLITSGDMGAVANDAYSDLITVLVAAQ